MLLARAQSRSQSPRYPCPAERFPTAGQGERRLWERDWHAQGAIKGRAAKRALSSCAMCDAEADWVESARWHQS